MTSTIKSNLFYGIYVLRIVYIYDYYTYIYFICYNIFYKLIKIKLL